MGAGRGTIRIVDGTNGSVWCHEEGGVGELFAKRRGGRIEVETNQTILFWGANTVLLQLVIHSKGVLHVRFDSQDESYDNVCVPGSSQSHPKLLYIQWCLFLGWT